MVQADLGLAEAACFVARPRRLLRTKNLPIRAQFLANWVALDLVVDQCCSPSDCPEASFFGGGGDYHWPFLVELGVALAKVVFFEGVGFSAGGGGIFRGRWILALEEETCISAVGGDLWGAAGCCWNWRRRI